MVVQPFQPPTHSYYSHLKLLQLTAMTMMMKPIAQEIAKERLLITLHSQLMEMIR